MDEVVIGSNGSKLVLAWAHRPVAGAETRLRAGLRVDGLSCDHDVYEFDEWQATAMIDIDAGEDLVRAAREVPELVGRG